MFDGEGTYVELGFACEELGITRAKMMAWRWRGKVQSVITSKDGTMHFIHKDEFNRLALASQLAGRGSKKSGAMGHDPVRLLEGRLEELENKVDDQITELRRLIAHLDTREDKGGPE